jgi:hypothetical protein
VGRRLSAAQAGARPIGAIPIRRVLGRGTCGVPDHIMGEHQEQGKDLRATGCRIDLEKPALGSNACPVEHESPRAIQSCITGDGKMAAGLVSLRLDGKTIRSLQRLARRRGGTRSEIVRDAVAKLLADEVACGGDSPQEVWARVIGSVCGVGRRDLSKRTGEKFREVLEQRARKRR